MLFLSSKTICIVLTNTWKSVGRDYNNPLILSNMQPPKPKSKNTSLDFQTNLKREDQTQNNILADELKKTLCSLES